MKKTLPLILFFQLTLQTAFSQNVGIGTTTPQSKLDINGDIALRSTDITIATTYNYALNVNSVKQINYKLKSSAVPVGNFILAGITAGVEGRLVSLSNRTGSAMEIYNEDATAVAANRIQTGTGATIAVFPNGNVTLQYDVTDQRWIVKSVHNNSLDYFGGGSGTSYWDLSGTNISNTNTGNIGIGTTPAHSRLEINGRVGSSVALFGADAFGVGISSNNPEIGFNYFYNGGTKTIKAGFGANFGMDPTNGNVYLGNFAGNKSTADFGDITGYQNVMTISQSGNIGINNPSPASKLDVVGQGVFKSAALSSPGNLGNLTSGGSLILSYNNDYALHIDASKIQAEQSRGNISGTIASPLSLNPFGGNVGIGLTNPRCRLSILSNTVAANNNTEVLQIAGKNPMLIFSEFNGTDYGYIKGVTDNTVTPQFPGGGLEIGTVPGTDLFLTANYAPVLTVSHNNNIGIGTTTPDVNYRLSVNGRIRAKEIRVNTDWADYVFDDDYKLKTLQEVEAFIKKHNHLPGVTDAATLQAEGMDVSKMQTVMMEKIEELTLYLIEANKKIEALQKENAAIKNKINL